MELPSDPRWVPLLAATRGIVRTEALLLLPAPRPRAALDTAMLLTIAHLKGSGTTHLIPAPQEGLCKNLERRGSERGSLPGK